MPTEAIFENVIFKDTPYYKGESFEPYILSGGFEDELAFGELTFQGLPNHIMRAIENDLVIVYDDLNESYQVSGTAKNQESPTFPAGFYERNTTVEIYYFVGTKLYRDIFELVTLEDEPDNSAFINFLEFIEDADIPLLSFVSNLVSMGSQYLSYASYMAGWKLKSSEELPLGFDKSIREKEFTSPFSTNRSRNQNQSTQEKPFPLVPLGLIGTGLFTGMLPLTIVGTGLLFLNNRTENESDSDSPGRENSIIRDFATQEVVQTETRIDQFLR